MPARIALSISPRILPWRAAIRLHGRLVGGYVPRDGVALRLLVRYPGAKQWTPLLALRTNRHGRFSFTWSYHAGRGVASYPFAIATTATESDYPWAAASSRALTVTFGRPTPRRRRSPLRPVAPPQASGQAQAQTLSIQGVGHRRGIDSSRDQREMLRPRSAAAGNGARDTADRFAAAG